MVLRFLELISGYIGDFSEFDILHFCGGHTRYLLSRLHQLGQYESVRNAVIQNQVIYTGTSAGSMVVAPSLLGIGRLDDLDTESFAPAEQVGLALVDFLILPHFNDPETVPSNYESIKSTDYQHPLVFLSDNQAIFIRDGICKFVSL
jgi:peptidase E